MTLQVQTGPRTSDSPVTSSTSAPVAAARAGRSTRAGRCAAEATPPSAGAPDWLQANASTARTRATPAGDVDPRRQRRRRPPPSANSPAATPPSRIGSRRERRPPRRGPAAQPLMSRPPPRRDRRKRRHAPVDDQQDGPGHHRQGDQDPRQSRALTPASPAMRRPPGVGRGAADSGPRSQLCSLATKRRSRCGRPPGPGRGGRRYRSTTSRPPRGLSVEARAVSQQSGVAGRDLERVDVPRSASVRVVGELSAVRRPAGPLFGSIRGENRSAVVAARGDDLDIEPCRGDSVEGQLGSVGGPGWIEAADRSGRSVLSAPVSGSTARSWGSRCALWRSRSASRPVTIRVCRPTRGSRSAAALGNRRHS